MWPRLGDSTPTWKCLLDTDRGEDHQASTPEATELADRMRMGCPATGDMACGEAAQLRGRARCRSLTPDTDGPQGGHREGQPQAFRPGRVEQLGLLPVLAAPFAVFEAAFDPGPQPIPGHIGGVRGAVSQPQPRVAIPGIPASQQHTGQLAGWRGTADNRAGPSLADLAKHLAQGRKAVAVWGRYWPCRLIRRNGCHPSCSMVINSQRADNPQSARTMAVQSVGPLSFKAPKRAAQCGRQAPARVTSTIHQATGMAQPQTTTLMESKVKR